MAKYDVYKVNLLSNTPYGKFSREISVLLEEGDIPRTIIDDIGELLMTDAELESEQIASVLKTMPESVARDIYAEVFKTYGDIQVGGKKVYANWLKDSGLE